MGYSGNRIDNNLTPGNIRDGVDIYGVTGNFSGGNQLGPNIGTFPGWNIEEKIFTAGAFPVPNNLGSNQFFTGDVIIARLGDLADRQVFRGGAIETASNIYLVYSLINEDRTSGSGLTTGNLYIKKINKTNGTITYYNSFDSYGNRWTAISNTTNTRDTEIFFNGTVISLQLSVFYPTENCSLVFDTSTDTFTSTTQTGTGNTPCALFGETSVISPTGSVVLSNSARLGGSNISGLTVTHNGTTHGVGGRLYRSTNYTFANLYHLTS